MQVYGMRHAESMYNLLGLCNDNPSNKVPLTRDGRRIAKLVGSILSTYPFDAIFVSHFPRTRETADIVNQHHGIPIYTDPRLGDRQTGGFEGRPSSEFRATIQDDDHKVGDGESYNQERERVLSFLEELSEHPYEHVLIISHREPLEIIAREKTGGKIKMRNCSMFPFEL